jgi:hypothetical protein
MKKEADSGKTIKVIQIQSRISNATCALKYCQTHFKKARIL